MIYEYKLLSTVLSTYDLYLLVVVIIIASTSNWGRLLDRESCPDVTENPHPAGDHGSQH